MGKEQRGTPANASAGKDGMRGDKVHAAAGRARQLLAGLRNFLSPRDEHRAGVYLPLVRVDGNE